MGKAGPHGCRLMVWPERRLAVAVGTEEKLAEALQQVDAMGLASKISAGCGRKNLEGYKELLELALANGIFDPMEKKALHRFRARHRIPDTEHLRILKELGWTQEDYEDGMLNTKWNEETGEHLKNQDQKGKE